MWRVGSILVLISGVAACSEPFITIPGGVLTGEVLDPPLEWGEVPDTIQLETRPSDPYSINIWGLALDNRLYVATGDDGTNWTAHIEADPGVRVRLAPEQTYRLQANLVTDATERAAVIGAYAAKYDVDPEDGWVQGGMIFRLERR